MTLSRKLKLHLNVIKQSIIEFIKFDYNHLKSPLSLVLLLKYALERLYKQELKSIQTLSTLYRTGWAMSKKPVIKEISRLFSANYSDKPFRSAFYEKMIDSVQPLANRDKFFADPKNIFVGNMIVLKSPSTKEKGVIIVAYNYYFPLIFKFFNTSKLAEKYHIVLEPSWAGLCDPSILLFTSLNSPVFVMAYEQRDWDFINSINTNLVPIQISANWWVDYRQFQNTNYYKRDIDVVVVASWSGFKRHYDIFRAIKKLKENGHVLKVVLAGYPGDMTMADIKDIAEYWGVCEQVVFYERIKPDEVANLMLRAKVNLLWSRMEGTPRVIIEGMFCDTPVILRSGFNFGQKYTYINDKTGEWADEQTLGKTILEIIDNFAKYSPRKFVMEYHTCEAAMAKLNDAIANSCANDSLPWTRDVKLKTNELHGMKYFDEGDASFFSADYDYITSLITKKRNVN